MKKALGCGFMAAFAPVVGCGGLMLLIIAVLFGGTGGILGWLFGGGAPLDQPNGTAPIGTPSFWTPTAVPVSCYVTPTAVVIILTPVPPTSTPFVPPTATPRPGTPTATPTRWTAPTNTPVPITKALPTRTPCPTSNIGWTPTRPANYLMANSLISELFKPIGSPTIGPATFAAFLAEMGSPALSEAEAMYLAIAGEGADPALALAFFEHESSGGRAGVAAFTRSLGNIRCSEGYQCYQSGNNGAFRSYRSWTEGARDWARLMKSYYQDTLGLQTLEQIIPVYAPSSDGNAPLAYIAKIQERVNNLRQRELGNAPHGSPYQSPYAVTQDYGCTDFAEFTVENVPGLLVGENLTFTGE